MSLHHLVAVSRINGRTNLLLVRLPDNGKADIYALITERLYFSGRLAIRSIAVKGQKNQVYGAYQASMAKTMKNNDEFMECWHGFCDAVPLRLPRLALFVTLA